jgi:phage portal protein BeeE
MRMQAPLLARMRAAITKAAVQALGVRDLFGNPAERLPGGWQRGLQLEPIGALTAFGAVWACNTRIANDIGKLEPLLLQRQSDGTWQRASEASPYWRPLRKPNNFQNRVQFLVLWVTFKLLFGNVYALKLRDERTMVRSLFILDPRRVTPMVTGWVLNIIKIAEADTFTPFVILRCVGVIVAFLGMILGWIG